MTLITDELVEKARLAFAHIELSAPRSGPRPTFEACMRSALLAILPDIVEQCVKVVREYDPILNAHTGFADEIIARIRSLAPKEEKTGS